MRTVRFSQFRLRKGRVGTVRLSQVGSDYVRSGQGKLGKSGQRLIHTHYLTPTDTDTPTTTAITRSVSHNLTNTETDTDTDTDTPFYSASLRLFATREYRTSACRVRYGLLRSTNRYLIVKY